ASGSNSTDPSKQSTVYILLGRPQSEWRATGFATGSDFRVDVEAKADVVIKGFTNGLLSVANAGNLNGDSGSTNGIDDLVVGDGNADNKAGKVYVFNGKSTWKTGNTTAATE